MDALLVTQWLGGAGRPIPMLDAASVSLARQAVRSVGAALGLDPITIESVATVASELAENQLAHARRGELVVRACARGEVSGIEVIAADRGHGIADPRRAFAEEPRPSGSLGAGLAGVRRFCDELDIDVRVGEGTCIWARKFASRLPRRREIAVFGRPHPGESVSGDAAAFVREGDALVLGVADGLGHGPLARRASLDAMAVLRERPRSGGRAILEACDDALAKTRGAVMATLSLDERTSQIEHAAVGNVAARIYRPREARAFLGSASVLGSSLRARARVIVEAAAAQPGEVLALFTDGLVSRASIADDLAIQRAPAIVIAQHMVETYARDTDDALILICR